VKETLDIIAECVGYIVLAAAVFGLFVVLTHIARDAWEDRHTDE
jgi:hypothetical protein